MQLSYVIFLSSNIATLFSGFLSLSLCLKILNSTQSSLEEGSDHWLQVGSESLRFHFFLLYCLCFHYIFGS